MTAVHQRSNTYSHPTSPRNDPFFATQCIYEEQRRAFLREQLQRKRRSTCLPALTQTCTLATPEPSASHTPDNLELASPFALRSSYRSYAIENKGEVVASPRWKQRFRPTRFFREGLDALMAKCKETERLPDVGKKVKREQQILKKYSQRMDWTLDVLQKNGDLEYKVLSSLFQFLAQEKSEDEDFARRTASAVRNGRTIEFNRRLQPKRKPRQHALVE